MKNLSDNSRPAHKSGPRDTPVEERLQNCLENVVDLLMGGQEDTARLSYKSVLMTFRDHYGMDVPPFPILPSRPEHTTEQQRLDSCMQLVQYLAQTGYTQSAKYFYNLTLLDFQESGLEVQPFPDRN
jgi:hypothetical protein